MLNVRALMQKTRSKALSINSLILFGPETD